MSDVLITSDEHYGHHNIIEYCNRPFTSTDHMRETLIERHNKKVPNKKSYLTIHIGDLFWNSVPEEEAIRTIDRLHGHHAFIYGNHDELMEKSPALRAKFDWVLGKNKDSGIQTIYFDKTKIILCHFAMRVWERSHKGSWHLYGHSHQELPPLGKSFDVGVEGHNYEPWTLEEVRTKMSTLDSHHVITPDTLWAGKELPK